MARTLVVSAVTMLVYLCPAFASPIAVDGTYHEFSFGLAPGAAGGCLNENCSATTDPVAELDSTSPWTFSGAASIFVLDIGDIGDIFGIADNGTSLGTTSSTTGTGRPCDFDIGCALENTGPTGYSSGTFLVGAGDHSISFSIVANAPGTTAGNAVFTVSPTNGNLSSVPEPGTYLLTGSVLALLGLIRRRTKSSKP